MQCPPRIALEVFCGPQASLPAPAWASLSAYAPPVSPLPILYNFIQAQDLFFFVWNMSLAGPVRASDSHDRVCTVRQLFQMVSPPTSDVRARLVVVACTTSFCAKLFELCEAMKSILSRNKLAEKSIVLNFFRSVFVAKLMVQPKLIPHEIYVNLTQLTALNWYASLLLP